MPSKTGSFRVFYSWQSDLPDVSNQQLIRTALGEAAAVINEAPDSLLKVICDEATREVPGSPNIVESIFSKIRISGAFVCDLTKVAESRSEPFGELRCFCNPNVAIELGYAIRVLGWNRIVLVFNTAYGRLPDDLPFDARAHRVCTYNCRAVFENNKTTKICLEASKNAKGLLRGHLHSAIQTIISTDPKRPRELDDDSPMAIKRARDLIQLQEIFGTINLRTFDHLLNRIASGNIPTVNVSLFNEFNEILRSTSFHIDDPGLAVHMRLFRDAWREAFAHTRKMKLTKNGKELCFPETKSEPRSKKNQQLFEYTCAQRGPLESALKRLLKYVRKHFIAIDLKTTGFAAVTKYSR